MGILKTYKSKSGETALQIMGDSMVIYGNVFRLESNMWHSVCITKELDHEITDERISTLIESFDQLIFDLENSSFVMSSL